MHFQQYWQMYYDLKTNEYYYQLYAVHAGRQRDALSIICALGSAACVLSWYQSGVLPILWASLIVLAQVVSVAQPYLPFDKRLTSANYIHSDLSHLILEIEKTWYSFSEETPDHEVLETIAAYQEEYQRIEERFADANTFPPNQRLLEQAKTFTKNFFRRYPE